VELPLCNIGEEPLDIHSSSSELKVECLMDIAVGSSDDDSTWNELPKRFGVTVTDDIQIPEILFWVEVEPDEQFPLNRQWICPTNKLAGQMND
jgi:hypothetical protein